MALACHAVKLSGLTGIADSCCADSQTVTVGMPDLR